MLQNHLFHGWKYFLPCQRYKGKEYVTYVDEGNIFQEILFLFKFRQRGSPDIFLLLPVILKNTKLALTTRKCLSITNIFSETVESKGRCWVLEICLYMMCWRGCVKSVFTLSCEILPWPSCLLGCPQRKGGMYVRERRHRLFLPGEAGT